MYSGLSHTRSCCSASTLDATTNTQVGALTEMVNTIRHPAPSATASTTNIRTAPMNMIEEGLSDNDPARQIVSQAQSSQVHTSRSGTESPPVEMVTPDTPIAETGTNENAFSHLAGAASDHFAAGQALTFDVIYAV
ncbi:hypothetical protein EDB87DRAFT_1831572 [Lactarius vividus]|nr:hypothetical protein EDB87DRAFT_1831572 [Lactarius vividus]